MPTTTTDDEQLEDLDLLEYQMIRSLMNLEGFAHARLLDRAWEAFNDFRSEADRLRHRYRMLQN